MTLRALLSSIAITGMLAGTAHAGGEQGFLVLDSTLLKPIGEDGQVSNSLGYGAEFRMLDNREVLTCPSAATTPWASSTATRRCATSTTSTSTSA
jgi:hypothetical protein